MYIFGGILELTKELNEMLIYDFVGGKFSIVGQEAGGEDSNARAREDESPGLKVSRTKTLGGAG